MRYDVVLVGALLLAAPAIAATWNEIDGTADADHIRGSAAPDRIRGLEGNDVLRGRAGDDRLVGGPGDDVLNGGPGQDTYVCGGGEDVVVVDFSRRAEQIGNGCEAVIIDVSRGHRAHRGPASHGKPVLQSSEPLNAHNVPNRRPTG